MDDIDSTTGEDWYSNDAATFGDRVAGAREALGLTQSDLARKLGVKLKTVQGWEDDISEPRANKLQMLSGVLNVSLMWLLNGEGEGIAAPGDEAEIPADISEILGEIRQLKSQLHQTADRLALMEKRLRKTLKESA